MDSNFVNNIIPRLKAFAQRVEIKEALVDKVWVIYGDSDLIEYEFERSGEITITKNGDSYDGSWRIMGSGRLRIITNFANKSLAYDFSLHGILVMKIAGRQNSPFLLYDPKVVKNGNIERHLVQLELKSERIKILSEPILSANQIYQGYEIFWFYLIGLSIIVFFVWLALI
jgi:hypothetical protein